MKCPECCCEFIVEEFTPNRINIIEQSVDEEQQRINFKLRSDGIVTKGYCTKCDFKVPEVILTLTIKK